jgi:hypothetical protein
VELGELDGDMKKTGKRVAENADRLVRRCALAVDAAVVLATPVDTGRARSNWQVEVGSPASGTIDSGFDKGGGSAISQGKDAIESYKGESNKAGIFITNNLPYIERLNDGWSAQAPAGFVEKAMQVGIDAVSQEEAKIVDGTVQEDPK